MDNGLDLDDDWILPADDAPPVFIDPPTGEGGRPTPSSRAPIRDETQLGPWFAWTMVGFVSIGLLSMVTLTAGTTGGMALSAGIATLFGLLYLGFFLLGSFWFEGHRRSTRRPSR